jgi:type II secretory ATPase GspE/PulE/Tfp pilus assembly ATPase PilB-like protein
MMPTNEAVEKPSRVPPIPAASVRPGSIAPEAKELLDLALSLYKSTHIDDILSQLRQKALVLFQAEDIRLFAYDAVDNELYTRIRLVDAFVELKFTLDEHSVVGYSAFHKKVVALDDVRDPALLAAYPGIIYNPRYEERTGVRIRSIISVPMLENDSDLVGVIQLINTARPVKKYRESLDLLVHLGKLVATAVFHHDERQRRATKYDLLLEEGVITRETLADAARSAKENPDDPIRGDLVSVLLEKYNVPEDAMKASLSRYYLTDFYEFNESVIIPSELLSGFNVQYLKNGLVVPVDFSDGILTLVMDDPFNSALVRDLKRSFKAKGCLLYVGFRQNIIDAIAQGSGQFSEEADTESGLEVVSADEHDGRAAPEEEDILDEDAPLVVQVVNKLILDAYERGVSDIHIEPGLGGQEAAVRFRKDGVCFQHATVPANLTPAVINRTKVMAHLKLEEHRFPQSGKIRLKYKDTIIELRVEVTPTVGRKEDVVMRILAGGTFMAIEDLDLSPDNQTALLDIISKPYGILLAVGPTGSGKTTTLHAILHRLNSVEKKIWTVEDPVEITQPGLRQVQVNLNIKPEPFDFAKAMRSFLRADPDIIMVGEMRDKETATIAVEASLTGHLVLSTLHTNSAPETITRLIEMGIDPLNVSDSLLGVLAQRLVRLLCSDCKEAYSPGDEEIEALKVACGREHADVCLLNDPIETLYRPKGCPQCSNLGFRGRAGIHELLRATPAVKQTISAGQHISAIRDQALKDGMSTLKMDGIRRVVAGQTTLAEVLKVCID